MDMAFPSALNLALVAPDDMNVCADETFPFHMMVLPLCNIGVYVSFASVVHVAPLSTE